MQHIHNQATATSIEMAVNCLLQDICEFLVKSGVKAESKLINDIKQFKDYDYDAQTQIRAWGRKSGITDI